MSEKSHILNGRFLHNLNSWTVSGATYSPGDGSDHYGVAVLSTGGDYVSQSFSVPRLRSYSLSFDVKHASADIGAGEVTVSIVDSEGNTVYSASINGTADTWTANAVDLGLAPGMSYVITITNVSAPNDILLDDVILWGVAITRAEIASRVAAKLGRLATGRSLSTTPSESLTEGDYTYAIDAALRDLNAVNPDTLDPDIRYLESDQVNAAIDETEQGMLEQLESDYAVEADLTVGPRQERKSQVSVALSRKTGSDEDGGDSASRVTVGNVTYD